MQLERFLMLVRLLTAATVKSHYEVRGMGTLVSRMPPRLELFLGAGQSAVRRTVDPRTLDADAITAVGELIEGVAVVREGMVLTSFDVALRKFNGSHYTSDLFGQLVDLATALEATLASAERDSAGLTLRLRSRASALLATTNDPAPTIFKDVGLLYDLRSKLVHGGEVREKDLKKTINAISSVPPPSAISGLRTMLGHAVDRMRDLVRRAILARLCLAAEPDPVWPFDEQAMPSVDGLLADDATRELWRSGWQDRIATIGAPAAVSPPRAAVDFLSQEDR
jgi:Apea-like HEPN